MREKERRLEGRDLLLVGFTLFSMFFGAGNLIFPPNIAAQAGTQTWPAMLGLALSAVGLPVLGVVAVARSGGLDALGSRVHPAFARVFTIVAYLAIGPCLAIPRTATTSFEMAVPPFVGADAPIGVYQLVYSLVFFAAALFIALRPEKLTDRLGKILCPILVALIVVTFVGCLVNPLEGYGPATGDYATHAVVKGFIEGYQTMGHHRRPGLRHCHCGEHPRPGGGGGGRRGAGYRPGGGGRRRDVAGGLLHAGPHRRPVWRRTPQPGRRGGALTNVVGLLFGTVGSVLLAGIFLIACFNVCVGLISSCGEYFHSICPRLSYRGWAVLFALVSMAISNAGLTQILEVSAPVLSAIYPVAIVLIALSFFQRWLEGRRWVYPAAVLCTGVFSVLFALKGLKVPLDFLDALPLADVGLGWVLPAGVGVVLGLLLSGRKR